MITSTGSSQVKRVIQLQKKSKIRKENRQFVVEGVKMVCEAPFDRIEKVYMSERFATDNEDFVKKLGISDDKVETVAVTYLHICLIHRLRKALWLLLI